MTMMLTRESNILSKIPKTNTFVSRSGDQGESIEADCSQCIAVRIEGSVGHYEFHSMLCMIGILSFLMSRESFLLSLEGLKNFRDVPDSDKSAVVCSSNTGKDQVKSKQYSKSAVARARAGALARLNHNNK